MATSVRQLPSISVIDAADEKMGSFLSDLDDFTSSVKALASNSVPLQDAVFMSKAGIDFEEPPTYIDPALVARLLVFTDEILADDLDTLRRDAESLRSDLLWIYRMQVIEPSGRRDARERSGS